MLLHEFESTKVSSKNVPYLVHCTCTFLKLLFHHLFFLVANSYFSKQSALENLYSTNLQSTNHPGYLRIFQSNRSILCGRILPISSIQTGVQANVLEAFQPCEIFLVS